MSQLSAASALLFGYGRIRGHTDSTSAREPEMADIAKSIMEDRSDVSKAFITADMYK